MTKRAQTSAPEKNSDDQFTFTKTLLPGFGRPLNYVPDNGHGAFGIGLSYVRFSGISNLPLVTCGELSMLRFMNRITDKSDWYFEVNNPETTTKWKEATLASTSEDMTEKMVDYCLDELRYKASQLPSPPTQLPPMLVYMGNVVKTDTALCPQFKEDLQRAVSKFEASISDRRKAQDSEAGGMVWNLVDPSLYPLVYGRTRILNGEVTTLDDCIDQCGRGRTTRLPTKNESKELGPDHVHFPKPKARYSRNFQWLPCEVDISGIDRARITSYINNIHPQREKPLYRLVERLIDACIPSWNASLDREPRNNYYDYRIKFIGEEDTDEDFEANWIPEPDRPFEPPIFDPIFDPQFNLRQTYGKRGLQVIVKLVNIELTPERPQFDGSGGIWQLEGELNEHVAATSLYYYSDSNITQSSVSFRQWFYADDISDLYMCHRSPSDEWLATVYGWRRREPAIQYVGGVETREGRLLTYPNILQHRVEPFKLIDPTKPGHRKILALFLVDPHIEVISTAHVPCQQQEWWWDRVAEKASKPIELPRELQDLILSDVDLPFGLQEAIALRKALIVEREGSSLHRSQTFEPYLQFCL